ncbi:hypothetical protein PYW07_003166 [Mythimna separata]|uniref:Uncharacterized protein n=1 Tax=Mythimna separata TaxID=271217 RepID=A0AAD7YI26_MYTSE|nr:hypothetical protein PYW07_003166 [Mythimna separata]
MDQCSTPACPLFGNTGTVIVRLKMEVCSSCCKREECPASGCPELVYRPSGCEQCTRSRLFSKYNNSDCDSDVTEKSRPYRASAARSRNVNVCAAVCLLLLVCGLSPRSSAAPHRSRASMERQKRDASEEPRLWANPCDYGSDKPIYTRDAKTIAGNLVSQARNAKAKTANYKDEFALKMHSFNSFDELVNSWNSSEYLPKELLPEKKVLSEDDIKELVNSLDSILPGMYKGLKLIVAGLNSFLNEELSANLTPDESLKNNINKTMHDVRAVLCHFYDIMNIRNLKIEKVMMSEVPNLKNDLGVTLFRDTLIYLEYLEQVFEAYPEK